MLNILNKLEYINETTFYIFILKLFCFLIGSALYVNNFIIYLSLLIYSVISYFKLIDIISTSRIMSIYLILLDNITIGIIVNNLIMNVSNYILILTIIILVFIELCKTIHRNYVIDGKINYNINLAILYFSVITLFLIIIVIIIHNISLMMILCIVLLVIYIITRIEDKYKLKYEWNYDIIQTIYITIKDIINCYINYL